MDTADNLVDFGFTRVVVPAGAHVCQIFEDDEERSDAFLRFLLKGLELRELCAGFSDAIGERDIAPLLPESHDPRSLRMIGASRAYFHQNCFDPDRMIELLTSFHQDSRHSSFTGGRVIGEMSPIVQDLDGGDRLLEYEARVNVLLRDRPMTVMCQYHAHKFSGSTLMDVLKANELMVVRGTIVHNPFYIPPETILAG